MKNQSLAFWAGLCIFSGMFAVLAMQLMIDAANMRRAEERAATIGSAVAGGIFVLGGIVLLALHFVRRKK